MDQQTTIKHRKSLLGYRKWEFFMNNVDNNLNMRKKIQLSTVLQRELKGKVISKVAKEIGVGVSLLHDWCNSSRTPSAKNMWQLKKVADYLGMSLEELLFDDTNERQIISSTVFTDRGVQYRVNIEKVKGK